MSDIKIIFIRHGEAANAWGTHEDPCLSEIGLSQATNLIKHEKLLDLNDYFSDPDGQSLQFEAYDNENILADDLYDLVIRTPNGVATYDPISMYYYEPTNMDKWTLSNVIFVARDPSGSIATSNPITFAVLSATFTADSDFTTPLEEDDSVVFTGAGRPGIPVYVNLGTLRVGQTLVDENGSWSFTLPASQLDPGINQVTFTYGGSSDVSITETVEKVGGEQEGMGALGKVLIGVGVIVALAILGLVFVFFFVEFEDDEDFETPVGKQDVQEEDPYAWAKQRTNAEQQNVAAAQQTVTSQPVVQADAHPGWRWDETTQQWVPDPSTMPGQ